MSAPEGVDEQAEREMEAALDAEFEIEKQREDEERWIDWDET